MEKSKTMNKLTFLSLQVRFSKTSSGRLGLAFPVRSYIPFTVPIKFPNWVFILGSSTEQLNISIQILQSGVLERYIWDGNFSEKKLKRVLGYVTISILRHL